MSYTLEIEDKSDDIVSDACDELKSAIREYLDDDPDTEHAPELYDDFNYSGRFDEIIDSSVPIYYSDIEAFWYCNKHELIETYQNHGIGDNPMENDGMTAIYLFIMDKVSAWYEDNKDDIYDEWLSEQERDDDES